MQVTEFDLYYTDKENPLGELVSSVDAHYNEIVNVELKDLTYDAFRFIQEMVRLGFKYEIAKDAYMEHMHQSRITVSMASYVFSKSEHGIDVYDVIKDRCDTYEMDDVKYVSGKYVEEALKSEQKVAVVDKNNSVLAQNFLV